MSDKDYYDQKGSMYDGVFTGSRASMNGKMDHDLLESQKKHREEMRNILFPPVQPPSRERVSISDKYLFVDDWFDRFPEWLTKFLPIMVGTLCGVGYSVVKNDSLGDTVGNGLLGLFAGMCFVALLILSIKVIIELIKVGFIIGTCYLAYHLYGIPSIHHFVVSLFDGTVHLLGIVLDQINTFITTNN